MSQFRHTQPCSKPRGLQNARLMSLNSLWRQMVLELWMPEADGLTGRHICKQKKHPLAYVQYFTVQ